MPFRHFLTLIDIMLRRHADSMRASYCLLHYRILHISATPCRRVIFQQMGIDDAAHSFVDNSTP